MKSLIQSLSIIAIIIFSIVSCQKDEFDFDDESIEVSSYPSISVYKTKGDYFDYVDLQLTDDGRLNGIPSYNIGDPNVEVDGDGIAHLTNRFNLKNGYILAKGVSPYDIFTNITIDEYIDYNTNSLKGWTDSMFWERIADLDPFTEYYYFGGLDKSERIFTLGEINAMIEDGTLEVNFKKLK